MLVGELHSGRPANTFESGKPSAGRLVEAESAADLHGAKRLDPPRRSFRVGEGASVQPPETLAWADPAEEVLVRVRPTFIQLAAVPLIEEPAAAPEPPWLDD